jgi:hypothetical protein
VNDNWAGEARLKRVLLPGEFLLVELIFREGLRPKVALLALLIHALISYGSSLLLTCL